MSVRPVAETALPDNTEHASTHAPGRIRTRSPSKQVAVDPHLRPRGNWVRLSCTSINTLWVFFLRDGLKFLSKPPDGYEGF